MFPKRRLFVADVSGKLLPRNLAAFRAGIDPEAVPQAAGNPASTLLQSGVGNCFPGLEFDMRNLERRFFPFLEVDTNFTDLVVASVDLGAASNAATEGSLSPASLAVYKKIAAVSGWQITRLKGDFGPLGDLDFAIADLPGVSFGPGRLPADAWTAVRLLKEGVDVTITLRRGSGAAVELTAPRNRYLDPDGSLAAMFEVGEMSQSLCSPWTHDFRDCGCYYWASNHPDIALPPRSLSAAPVPSDNLATTWLREDRNAVPAPVADATNSPPEVPHNAINRMWQQFGVVLERREQLTPYAEQLLPPDPLPDKATLLLHLRFAAGVELAVMQEYLVAAFTLKRSAGEAEPLQGDLRAAFFEMLHVAIGEMRHLRSVNHVIKTLEGAAYTPALRVAAQVPLGPGVFRPLSYRALTTDVMKEFVEVEAPSQSVDSLYARILSTLEAMPGADDSVEAIRAIMAEGSDHWQTFLFVQEWLGRHQEATYLRATLPANHSSADYKTLQTRYIALLQDLYAGYSKGMPAGAADVNAARNAMLGDGGIEGALEKVAASGKIPEFDAVADARFAPLAPPP